MSTATDDLLDEIRELLGDEEYLRHERGWIAKANEDAATLRVCLDLMRKRMDGEPGSIVNPGGWLHSTYHKTRELAKGGAR